MARASRTAALLEHCSRLASGTRAPYVLNQFAIGLDTREQKVGQIDLSVPIVVEKLPAGDLAVVGHEADCWIDRKQLDDFIGCLTRDRGRFERMLAKRTPTGFAAILVEATLQDVHYHRYRSTVSPPFVVARVAELTMAGTPVFFTGPIDVSTDFAVRLLRSWWRARVEPVAKRALEKELLA